MVSLSPVCQIGGGGGGGEIGAQGTGQWGGGGRVKVLYHFCLSPGVQCVRARVYARMYHFEGVCVCGLFSLLLLLLPLRVLSRAQCITS